MSDERLLAVCTIASQFILFGHSQCLCTVLSLFPFKLHAEAFCGNTCLNRDFCNPTLHWSMGIRNASMWIEVLVQYLLYLITSGGIQGLA